MRHSVTSFCVYYRGVGDGGHREHDPFQRAHIGQGYKGQGESSFSSSLSLSLSLSLSRSSSLCGSKLGPRARRGGIGRKRKWCRIRRPQVIRSTGAIKLGIEIRVIIACACKRVRRRIFRLGETWCTASRPAWADIASIGSSLMRHEIKSRYAELTTERNKNVHRKWFCRSRVDKRSYDEISASARDTFANVSQLAFLRWTREMPKN